MIESILVALITGAISLIGTVLTILSSQKKTDEQMKISQAVTDTKIEELTREVREHNNFAHRMPVLEEQMKVANHRIADIEEAMKK